MKKKIFSLLLTTLLVASFVAGCGGGDKKAEPAPAAPAEKKVADIAKPGVKMTKVAEAGEQVDYMAAYDPILQNILYHIVAETDPADVADEWMGIADHVKAFHHWSYWMLGYVLQDINGDNIPELFIGTNPHYDSPDGKSTERQPLYVIYALDGNTPNVIAEGRLRQMYYLMDNNDLLQLASEGAASSIYGTYKLDFNGTQLKCTNYRFSAINDDNHLIGYYENSYGKFDKSISKKITKDDFETTQNALYKQCIHLPLTSFKEYAESKQQSGPYQPPTITSAQAVIGDAPHCIRFDATNSEYGKEIAIVGQQTLKSFELLKLTYRDSNDGKVHFNTQTLYSVIHLIYPFVTRVDFPGSIPQYGISFRDKDEKMHYYSINQSGEDGSLQLVEFEP